MVENGVLVLEGDFNIIGILGGELGLTNCYDGEYGQFYAVETSDGYEGEYVVIPRVYEQTLNTAHKVMADNVTVTEIPLTRTSNPQGGLTVLIG